MADLKKVLIVDDDPDALEFAKCVVSELDDVCIVTAGDGEEGVQKAKDEVPDLIILDVMMPKKDGFAAFSDIRNNASTAEIPIIMLTGVSGETGVKMSGEAMGEYFGKAPQAFIDKPVNPTILEAEAKKALGL